MKIGKSENNDILGNEQKIIRQSVSLCRAKSTITIVCFVRSTSLYEFKTVPINLLHIMWMFIYQSRTYFLNGPHIFHYLGIVITNLCVVLCSLFTLTLLFVSFLLLTHFQWSYCMCACDLGMCLKAVNRSFRKIHLFVILFCSICTVTFFSFPPKNKINILFMQLVTL